MAFTSKVLAMVARVLGRKYDVNIMMGNYRTASTDGKTIYLPLVKGEAAVNLARGYVDHESAHIRLTDFSIALTRDFRGQLLNVIEDIRIEKSIGKDYPGCASNLRNLSSALNEQYGVFEPNPLNPSSIVLAWISCRGRVDILSHDSMNASAEAAEPIARVIFGKQFPEAQRLVAMIRTLPEDHSGTKAAADLRDQFMDLLEQAKDDIDNQPPPPETPEEPEPEQEEEKEEDQQKDQQPASDDQDSEQPDDQQGDTADQDDTEQNDSSEFGPDSTNDTDSEPGTGDPAEESGETSPEGEEKGDDQNDSNGSGSDGDSEGDKTGEENGAGEGETGGDDANGQTDAQGGSQGDTDGDDSGASQNQNQGSSAGLSSQQIQAITEALEEALGSDIVEFGDIGRLLQELLLEAARDDSFVADEIPRLPVCIPHPLSRGAKDFPDLSLIKSHSAKLRAQLQGLIQASKLKRSIARRSGRKLDTRTLTRLSVGDDRMFISRDEKKGTNTAVMFIVDGSSSMGRNEPGEKMFTATRSCFVALEAMYAIPGVTSAAVEFNDTQNTVFNLCGWGQKPDSKLFNHNSSDCTQLSTALWCGWGELLNRPEPRKIAIIFSDGETDSSDVQSTDAAIKRMKQDGIEFVGIGIQDRHLLKHLPKETRIINQLDQLTPALLDLLRDKLLEAA